MNFRSIKYNLKDLILDDYTLFKSSNIRSFKHHSNQSILNHLKSFKLINIRSINPIKAGGLNLCIDY